MNPGLMQLIPFVGVLGMLIAVITFFSVKRYPAGDEKMQEIAEKIHAGAMVFLKREYQIIFVFMIIIFIALATMLSLWTGIAYLSGAILSGGWNWGCSHSMAELVG